MLLCQSYVEIRNNINILYESYININQPPGGHIGRAAATAATCDAASRRSHVPPSRGGRPAAERDVPGYGPVAELHEPRLVHPAADADGGFALIFSMSHVVCNGGTYYQLLNMLSADGEVVAMNPTRQEALQDKVYEYMGRKEYAFLNGAANMCNALRKVFFGKNPQAYCFLVDDAKLSEAKAAAKAKPDAPDRISANDVLTSAYGKVCQSSLLIMACDFKGRIEGTSATDAAQYHAALLLDADGYGSPASIRKALMGPPPLSRAALPTFWKAQGSRLGLITSWAALKSLSIPSCQLTLHTPCEQTSGLVVKAQDDTCIVFNPKPGKLAMLCMTTKLSPDELMAALPFEGPLNPFMWEHG